MKQYTLATLLLAFTLSIANAADGVITLKSPFNTKDTMDKLENLVKQKGLTVFARVNHSAGAATIDKQLRPTELLIFGHPKGGTPLMECEQMIGLDLPLKALVWQDADQQVWIGYNDMRYLARKYAIENCPAITKIQQSISNLVTTTISKP